MTIEEQVSKGIMAAMKAKDTIRFKKYKEGFYRGKICCRGSGANC